MSDSHVHIVNGPTDMAPDDLAERKRLAAVDFHKAELVALELSLKALTSSKKPGAADKVVEQRKMIAAAKAALDAAKGT